MPVLYQASQLGGAPPSEGQRRFILDDDSSPASPRRWRLASRQSDWRIGIAPHSLRAVTPEALDRAVALARGSIPPCRSTSMPPSRSRRSRTASPGAAGGRSTGCSTMAAGQGWCLIHCTHMTPGGASPARRERRGRRPLPDDRGQSRRWLLSDPRFSWPRAALRRRHRFQRLDQPGRGTALARIWLPPAARGPQRRRDPARRLGRRLAGRRALAGGAKALGRRSARIEAGGGRISWCSTRSIRR